MNIIDVKRQVPPLPKHRVQDTRNGHVMVLDKDGLEPTYVMKKVSVYERFSILNDDKYNMYNLKQIVWHLISRTESFDLSKCNVYIIITHF